MACLFYLLVLAAIAAPTLFIWTVWRDAKKKHWNWTTESSRAMYVDVSKTLITASGIAVALVASESSPALDPIGKFSARIGVICLIVCIPAGLTTILALTRGYEKARSRNIEAGGSEEEGQLFDLELLFILVSSAIALSSFLVGLLFLGRITFHT